MSWLSDFLHPANAYNAAQNQSNQYYNQAQGGLQPYSDMGQNAGGALQKMLEQLSDPQKLQGEWLKNYEQSPYAQQLQGQAQSSGMDAASQMGLMGSSSALNNIQQQSGNIMQKDRNDYLQNLMQQYNQGLGLGENLYGQGANAAGQMGQNAMTQGGNMANLEYGKRQAGPEMLGGLGKGAIQMLMQYLTGGMGEGGFGRGMWSPKTPSGVTNNYY